ncbi:uncharacterized protein LOC141854938 [Brevipalpus obovatus]|uniref:uncharacterized protein LOC141854938 n=1 Tax=Brevipalpus obovatus TaxID=246614 RepID=UPI003D9E6BAB
MFPLLTMDYYGNCETSSFQDNHNVVHFNDFLTDQSGIKESSSSSSSSNGYHSYHNYHGPSATSFDRPDGSFSSELFAHEIVPLEVGVGYDPYGPYNVPVDEKPLLSTINSHDFNRHHLNDGIGYHGEYQTCFSYVTPGHGQLMPSVSDGHAGLFSNFDQVEGLGGLHLHGMTGSGNGNEMLPSFTHFRNGSNFYPPSSSSSMSTGGMGPMVLNPPMCKLSPDSTEKLTGQLLGSSRQSIDETREEVVGEHCGMDPWSNLEWFGSTSEDIKPNIDHLPSEHSSSDKSLLVINPHVVPNCEILSKPMRANTSSSTPTSTSTPACKSRRKKRDQVEYLVLDASTCGDEKTEFIKYVGKGSYKCQICDIYSKNNKDYIQDHINIKHYNIKKNYECLLCQITFAWRSGAFKHLKKYHQIEGKNTINFFRAISKRHVYNSQRKRK